MYHSLGTDCTDCKEGWFGEDCSVECTDTEKHNCTDQGDKTCTSNWNGPNCDRLKQPHFYHYHVCIQRFYTFLYASYLSNVEIILAKTSPLY